MYEKQKNSQSKQRRLPVVKTRTARLDLPWPEEAAQLLHGAPSLQHGEEW